MIQLLEKTHALGFYFCFGKNVTRNTALLSDYQPSLIEIEEQIYAWKFIDAHAQWQFPYTFDGVLYKTSDICTCIEQCVGNNYEELIHALSMIHSPNVDDVGLCYMHTLCT
jgi:hypothetical protein